MFTNVRLAKFRNRASDDEGEGEGEGSGSATSSPKRPHLGSKSVGVEIKYAASDYDYDDEAEQSSAASPLPSPWRGDAPTPTPQHRTKGTRKRKSARDENEGKGNAPMKRNAAAKKDDSIVDMNRQLLQSSRQFMGANQQPDSDTIAAAANAANAANASAGAPQVPTAKAIPNIVRVPVAFRKAASFGLSGIENCYCCAANFTPNLKEQDAPERYQMWLMYEEKKKDLDLEAIALNISQYQYVHCYRPAWEELEGDPEEQQKLHFWRPEMVHEHLKYHILDPGMDVIKDLRDIDAMLRILKERAFYTERLEREEGAEGGEQGGASASDELEGEAFPKYDAQVLKLMNIGYKLKMELRQKEASMQAMLQGGRR